MTHLLDGLNRGWQFVRLNGKIPIGQRWQLGGIDESDITRKSLAIQQHVANGGNAGVITGKPSGIVVIDIDIHSGAILTADDFPPTWTVITGKGGRHLYFKRPAVPFIGNAAKGLFPIPEGHKVSHIDIRGDGGQVVYIGSIHPDTGAAYEWAPNRGPSDLPLAEFPASLLEKIQAPKPEPERREYTPTNGGGANPWVAAMLRNMSAKLAATNANRNDSLNATALILGHYCPAYLSESEITDALMDAMRANGYIQSDGEYAARATIESGLYAGMRTPCHPPEREYARVQEEPAQWDYEADKNREEHAQSVALDRYDTAPKNSGKILLVANTPRLMAEAVLADRAKLHHARYRGEWFVHDGGSYLPVSDEWMAAHCRRVLERCDVPEIVKGEPTGSNVPLLVKNQTVSECAGSLMARDGVILGDGMDAPMWRGEQDADHAVSDCFPMANGIYDVRKFHFIGRRPDLFTIGHAGYNFDPDAPSPDRWIEFLRVILGETPKAILCLQEWMGYQLTASCPHHKSLYIHGPKRAGKGTIASIMTALVGAKACTAPTLDQLAQPFGMQPLIGKRSAIIGDARFAGPNIATSTERLLGLIANDFQSAQRKNMPNWNGRLGTKITIMSNDLPKLRDDSATIMSRFLFIELSKSFYGAENLQLSEQLLAEMPGIFAWSLEGLERLRSQGRFTEPEYHAETLSEMESEAAPLRDFIEEHMVQEEAAWENCATVYEKYKEWSEGSRALSKEYFGRQMRGCGIKKERRRLGDEGDKIYIFAGWRLKTAWDKKE